MSILKALLKPFIPAGLRANLANLLQVGRYYRPYVAGKGRAKPPHSVDIEITFRCNARCAMCPLHGTEENSDRLMQQARETPELSTERLKALLDELRRMGVVRVQFTGGEPFLRKDLFELVRHAKGLGFSLGIISNGSVLTGEHARILVAAGLDTLHFSIDGPADIHDEIRAIPGLFRQVEETVALLNRAKEEAGSTAPHITIGATVSTLNQGRLTELVDAIAGWKAALNLGRLFFMTPAMDAETNAIFQRGRTKGEDQTISIPHREVDVALLNRDLENARNAARRLGVPLTAGYQGEEEIQKRFYDDRYTDHNKCFYPWHSARVDPFGKVYPCSMNNTMGDLTESSFAEIWNGPAYVEFRRTLKEHGLFPSCAKCCVLSDDKAFWKVLPKIGS